MALALLLYFRLVRTLGSMGVASQAYLRSGVSVMLGILLLGETFRPAVGLGLVAVILGVAANNLPRRRRPAPACKRHPAAVPGWRLLKCNDTQLPLTSVLEKATYPPPASRAP